jgi:hypothetical protein
MKPAKPAYPCLGRCEGRSRIWIDATFGYSQERCTATEGLVWNEDKFQWVCKRHNRIKVVEETSGLG